MVTYASSIQMPSVNREGTLMPQRTSIQMILCQAGDTRRRAEYNDTGGDSTCDRACGKKEG